MRGALALGYWTLRPCVRDGMRAGRAAATHCVRCLSMRERASWRRFLS